MRSAAAKTFLCFILHCAIFKPYTILNPAKMLHFCKRCGVCCRQAKTQRIKHLQTSFENVFVASCEEAHHPEPFTKSVAAAGFARFACLKNIKIENASVRL